MHKFHLFTVTSFLLSFSILATEALNQPPTAQQETLPFKKVTIGQSQSEATNRCILLVNAANVSTSQFESIRSYVKKELRVKIEVLALEGDWSSLQSKAPSLMSDNRKVVVILGNNFDETTRIVSAPDNQWALVNISSFTNEAEPKKVLYRLYQATMRGIGYSLGLSTCQDVHCVMRLLKNQADLNEIGSNFCGPTRRDFQSSMLQKGINLSPIAIQRKTPKPPAAIEPEQ